MRASIHVDHRVRVELSRAVWTTRSERGRLGLGTHQRLTEHLTAGRLTESRARARGSNRLDLFHGSRFIRELPVATGQPIYPTPLGDFSIVVKQLNPWWYPPTQDAWAKGLKPVPPGPGNPLGTRWMGLSTPGVGIHGTSEPWSIGHSESHGCIRMQVPDAEWLYSRVHVGTPVFIIAS